MQRREGLGTRWNRRRFLGRLGWAGAALLLPHAGWGKSIPDTADCLLCLGSLGQSDLGTLHLVSRHEERWEQSGTAATARPVALAAHPLRPIVYVANAIKMYQREPRGTVEAFYVDRGSGRAELLARQPLSLSATEPRSLAVAPDGRSLLVAAFGGGAYNFLPLDEAGVPGQPSTILKQVGRRASEREVVRAHPAGVMFHSREGWAMGVDAGTDRLDSLHPQGPGFAVMHRLPGEVGSGLSAVVLDEESRLAIAIQRRRPALTSFRLAEHRGLVALRQISLNVVPTAITFHRERKLVYCATQDNSGRSRLGTWRVQCTTGDLERLAEADIPAGEVRAMQCAGNMLALASERGLITVALDAERAEPRIAELAVPIPGVSSLALVSGG